MEKFLYLLFGLLLLVRWSVSECQDGYEPIRDNECIDIDECSASRERQCGQLCANEPGYFRCGCLPGYVLGSDQRSCLSSGPDPVIYFRRRKDISSIDPAGLHPHVAVRRVGHIRSFDVHQESGNVYWIEARGPSIGMTPSGQRGQVEVFNLENLMKPESLKIDWMRHTLYWTDSKAKSVMRCLLNGSNPEIVLETQKRPKALVLDPYERLLFWSTSGKFEKIFRADFDGRTRDIVVGSRLQTVVSLDVDFIDKRLYWLDQGRGKIESANYQGADRSVVVHGISAEATGLSLLADSVYWLGTDPEPAIHRADRRTGRLQIRLRSDYFEPGLSNLLVMHPNKQPSRQFYNGDCTTWNNCNDFPHDETVSENKPFILFTANNTVRKINQDGSDHVYVITKNVNNLVDVDYDERRRTIFFADAGRGVIEMANLDGTGRTVIVGHTQIGTVEAIAFDWMRRQIYWTDSSFQHVAAANSLSGTRRIVASEGVIQPRGITVHPALNLVYWTDINGHAPKIVVASLYDGTFREDIITENVVYPSGITIDFKKNKLLWVDFGLSVIEQSTLEGLEREILYRITESNHINLQPHSLAVSGQFVWYTNWEEDMVVRVDRDNDLLDIYGDDIWHPSGIRAVDRNRKKAAVNPCNVFNGLCDQICTLAAENQVVCNCENGYLIKEDERTCVLEDPCRSGDAECGNNSRCWPMGSGQYECICQEGYKPEGNKPVKGFGCVEITYPVDSSGTRILGGPNATAQLPNAATTSATTIWPWFTARRETISHQPNETTKNATTTVIPTTTQKFEEHLSSCPESHEHFCLNGGTCSWIPALKDASCKCPVKFVGERCEFTSTFNKFFDDHMAIVVSGGVLLPLCCLLTLVGLCFICRRLSTGSLCKKSNGTMGDDPGTAQHMDVFYRRSNSYHQRRDVPAIGVYGTTRNDMRMETIDRSSFGAAYPEHVQQFSTFPRQVTAASKNKNNSAIHKEQPTKKEPTSLSPQTGTEVHEDGCQAIGTGYEDMSQGQLTRENNGQDTNTYIIMNGTDNVISEPKYMSTIEKDYSVTLV